MDSGAICDADGRPTTNDDATCLIFPTLDAAEAFCRAQVLDRPNIRFDILDAAGLRRPALFTIVHPSRVDAMDGSAIKIRRNTIWAVVFIGIAPPLFWFDWARHGGLLIMPTILGINTLLIGLRLLIMNYSHRSSERARVARVVEARGREANE